VANRHELEADRVAAQVMRMPSEENEHSCGCGTCPTCQKNKVAQTKSNLAAGPTNIEAPPSVYTALATPGRPLDQADRSFMESRFGHDFSRVRIHSGREAAESAGPIHARAYTVGSDIVFGAGEYAPASAKGRQLLAHELTHVIQQNAASPSSAPDVVQRAPTLDIVDAKSTGSLTASQRRAAASCPITCCDKNLGTLHAMPLFYHESRGAVVPAGSPRATGIGAELHFIGSTTQPASGLCHCDDMRMIQILTSTHPQDPRGKSSFVDDNPAGSPPFYGDTGHSGRGEHSIPAGYADAGEKVKTSESIYDRPYRTPAMLGTSDLSWMAETCVACIKSPGPDRILGCTTYGFTQHYNAAKSTFDPVAEVSPACRSTASTNFINTLSTDSTTTSYKFSAAPSATECTPPATTPSGEKKTSSDKK
jgi:hypothetical protein